VRINVEYAQLRDLQGRFVRIAEEDREVLAETVVEATELVYQQALENIRAMFNSSGRMENALRMVFDRLSGSVVGSVVIDGVGYRTQEFGGTHPFIIRAHGRALKWAGGENFGFHGDEFMFAPYVVHGPLRERSFLRSALEEKRPEIEALFSGRYVARFRE
jgi:hypothetical protein